jgi:hypothetical protein
MKLSNYLAFDQLTGMRVELENEVSDLRAALLRTTFQLNDTRQQLSLVC